MIETSAPASFAFSATQEKILDAAERLFGDTGFHGTSIRSIALAAEVNLASAHYHFGSKEKLYEAVFHRRIRPLNAERLARLDEVLAASASPGPSLRAILDTFIRPTLIMGRNHPSVLAFMSRHLANPPAFMRPLLAQEFIPVIQRYGPILQTAAPHLTPEQLFWRFQFVMGSVIYTTAHYSRLDGFPAPLTFETSLDSIIDQLTDFAAAGIGQLAPPR